MTSLDFSFNIFKMGTMSKVFLSHSQWGWPYLSPAILLPLLLSLKGFWREGGSSLVTGRSVHLSVRKGLMINTIELLQMGGLP